MTSETTAAGRFGTIEEQGDGHVLRFERRFDHPIERVWATISEPERIEGWLARAELELEEGADVKLQWLNRTTDEQDEEYGIETLREGENSTIARGTVTAVDPPRLLEYDTDVHGLLRWELREEDGGSLLLFSATLPSTVSDSIAAQVLSGWQMHLELLDEALAGRPITDWSVWPIDRWAELRDHYARTLAGGH
jgi:uncharacterized protein YndB with AHSA1/START domain